MRRIKDLGKDPRKVNRVWERFKTVLLVLLCVLCAVFTYFLVNSGVMKESIYSFSPYRIGSEAVSSEFVSENVLTSFTAFSEPELILIGKGDSRSALSTENPGYKKTVEAINRVLNGLHSPDTVYSTIAPGSDAESEILNAQFFIRYPCAHSVAFDASFAGIKDSEFLKHVRQYQNLFIAENGSEQKITVYIPNDDGSCVKAESPVASSVLSEVLSDLANFTGTEYVFSYDYADSFIADTAFAALTAVPRDSVRASTIRCGIPWNFAHDLSFMRSTEFVNRLLSTFGFNPNTIQQYTDQYGVLVFVGAEGTLSINPNGTVDYKRLSASAAKTDNSDVYTPTDEFMRIIDKVFKLCDINISSADFKLKFTQISAQTNTSETFFGIDCYVDGNRVITNDGNAIEVEIADGTIKRLRMCVRNIEKTDDETDCGTAADAVRKYTAENSDASEISDIRCVYDAKSTDGGEVSAEWRINGE